MTVTITIPAADCEALAFFLAERAGLWRRYAHDFGVKDANELPKQLAEKHAAAVQLTP